jgi:putative transcriptional regulator
MKDELFDELMESVRQGGAILRGEMKPSRSFTLEEGDVPDVAEIRARLGLSQDRMASLMGIFPWERCATGSRAGGLRRGRHAPFSA